MKLCDFGLSVALEHGSTLSDKQGTWAYRPPLEPSHDHAATSSPVHRGACAQVLGARDV